MEWSGPETLLPNLPSSCIHLFRSDELRKAFPDVWWIAESSEKLTQLLPARELRKAYLRRLAAC